MRRANKKPIWEVIAGLAGLLASGWMVWNWAPEKWWVEVVVVVTGIASVFLLTSWFLGRKKWGTVVAGLVFGLAILQRFEVLDWLTGILLVVVLGLISLID